MFTSNPIPEAQDAHPDDGLRKHIIKNMSVLNALEENPSFEDCIENILIYQRTWDAIDRIIPTANASLKKDWATTRFLDPDFAGSKMIGRINNLQIVAALLLTISVANLFADKFNPDEQSVGFPPDDYPYDTDSINFARGILNYICTILFAGTIMFGAVFTDMMGRFYTKSEQYVAVVKFYSWSVFAIVVPTWVGVGVLFVTFCVEIGIRFPYSVAFSLGTFGALIFALFIYFLLKANSTASASQASMYNTFTQNFCDDEGRVRPDILRFVMRELEKAGALDDDRSSHIALRPDLMNALLRKSEGKKSEDIAHVFDHGRLHTTSAEPVDAHASTSKQQPTGPVQQPKHVYL